MEAKEYDLIVIGTGSAMNIVNPFLRKTSGKVAVIDMNEPGGICLTRGCIPSKMILHPANMVKEIDKAEEFGIDAQINGVDFSQVMDRMHSHIDPEIDTIRNGLSQAEAIDYYPEPASFVEPYTLEVGDQLIKSNFIILCTGSRPLIPPIEGLEEAGYLTSRTALELEEKPESLLIIGGSYIGLEFAHFFSSMGTDVTVLEMLPQILDIEEPEVSALLEEKLGEDMDIETGQKVVKAELTETGEKRLITSSEDGDEKSFTADEIMVASGRRSNSDILEPEKGGIETDEKGWIESDQRLETTKENVWVIGDATGEHMLKHVANYESNVVYQNSFLGRNVEVDYHAVPYAVFTHPEVAGVGMVEEQAIEEYGEENLVIGFQKYEDTAKGSAMNASDYFVKIIMEGQSEKILGAHIIGPHASILIQELVDLMYTPDQTPDPVLRGMHIHPALSEVVERAFFNRMDLDRYHQMISEDYGDLPGLRNF